MRPVANLCFKSCGYGPFQRGTEGPRRFRGLPMRFLLRMAFWLTVILALLPSGGSQPAPKVNVSAGDAMSAAQATVSDMGSFFFSSRRRHTRSVSAFLLNRSSDLGSQDGKGHAAYARRQFE